MIVLNQAESQRWQHIRSFLGKQVHVGIDRPMGYDHNGILYPINYGYIPGILGGDGEEQDAYILGVPYPIDAFSGRVIGVIYREDDVEDKLVVAPEEARFNAQEIEEAVHFQERFFQSRVESIYS